MSTTTKVNRDRIFSLNHCLLCKYDSYQIVGHTTETGSCIWKDITKIPQGESASYGDMKNAQDQDATYIMPDLLSYSDYSGSTLEVANQIAFLKEFRPEWTIAYAPDKMLGYDETIEIFDIYGGHGTSAIAISIEWLLDPKNEEVADSILECLEALYDYPVINDDELSNYEMEQSYKEWESWGRYDFISGLEKRFDVELDFFPTEKFVDYSEEQGQFVMELFEKARERANVYWEAETGPGLYIDIDRVVEEVELKDIANFVVN